MGRTTLRGVVPSCVAVVAATVWIGGAQASAVEPVEAAKPGAKADPKSNANDNVDGASFDESTFAGLGARNIGSAAMSGRISALTAAFQKDGRMRIYVGSASGGVWRSDDAGTTFKPIFDDEPVQSIGALAVDPKNPDVLWVGTGESWTRNSVSYGDGVYKTVDGGETWTRLNLPSSTERIAKIVLDPRNTETAYVCVPGRLFSDSSDRGLYKTVDGGKTFSLVLKGANLSTGCSSVALDAKNPEVVYAGLWDFRRKGWTFRSGGDGPTATSGSGLYVSKDGGKSFADITATNGLAARPWGRVALATAPSKPGRVYAFIESEKSAVYVSDDGGKAWTRGDDSPNMVWRPFYFANLVVDPNNADRVYKPDGGFLASEDGCKSFQSTGNGIHGDVHDVWIDPNDSNTMIIGDDGGIFYSHDRGNHWWKGSNLPISQFYHVTVDNATPYHVYGGLQDNSSWMGDSSYPGGISNSRWENMYGGDGFYTFEDPSDPNYVYAESQGGYLGRVNKHTHEVRDIKPRPLKGEKLRFHWNTPVVASPNERGTIYIGAQFLFRSRDHGQTWQRISPDLTTNDPNKQNQEQSGGITVDNSSAEMHTVIYTMAESPKNRNVIWAGTDDGNVQVTRDAGKSWTNVTANVPGLPKNSWVSMIEASHFDENVAYATFDRHMDGDFTPWAYKTADGGKTWKRIAGDGIGPTIDGYAEVIREDTVDKNLLFLGTELGLFISLDAGAHWARFTGGHFPHVAVRDMAIQARDNDLVIATHGRGIWIVDDIVPLRTLSAELRAKDIAIVDARPVRQGIPAWGGWVTGMAEFVGDNPADDAVITYWQKKRHIFGPLKIEILDEKGQLVDVLAGSKRRGLNRVHWSMRLPPPRAPRGATVDWDAAQGPRVLPGTYTVRITKGTSTIEKKIEVGLDPNNHATRGDLLERKAAVDEVYALIEDMAFLAARIEKANGDFADRKKSAAGLGQKIDAWTNDSESLRKKIVATKEGGAITGEERLREFASTLYGALTGFDGKPTEDQKRYAKTLRSELDDVDADFAKLTSTRLQELNTALKSAGAQPVAILSRAEWDAATKKPIGGRGALGKNALREIVREGRAAVHPDEGDADDDEERDLDQDRE